VLTNDGALSEHEMADLLPGGSTQSILLLHRTTNGAFSMTWGGWLISHENTKGLAHFFEVGRERLLLLFRLGWWALEGELGDTSSFVLADEVQDVLDGSSLLLVEDA